mmetsp:Transcript_29756/g.63097  ORF Transcript_29756/g.63097 Transcript_29756/m.63097 type:complete len:1002 (-) Transcript_29756:423-3428(-)|eukprot:CAMPEP_0172300848 /NCGR_PEP_ID=MMETSP1058-20130122/2847_1 /TAXON_ID=83371 /ORGANISM="Detonula confervacea, Strain CCMP 353" /LENGTH=1001 /DNA_ID=CAMNT_0013010767 /DNA_START=320 /DNA_END=3325 /DNA_ORIENTATION=-
MKRALAKRVEKEMGEPIAPSRAPPSSLPMGYTGMNGHSGGGTGHPQSKIPRTNMAMASSSSLPMAPVSASPRDLPQSGGGGMDMYLSSSSKKRPRSPPNATSSGNTTAYQSRKTPDDENHKTTSAPKGRGPGRPRKSAVKRQQVESSDEDDADNSSFYLKQQNVALASELYSYRRRIYLLEREREFRRRECRVAGYQIGELSGVWKGLESAIGKELERNNLLNQAKTPFGGNSSNTPACTGSGSDVETVHSLLQSIHSLVSNPERIKSEKLLPQDSQHHVDDLNNFECYANGTVKMEESADLVEEKRRLKEMEDFTTDISSRAAILRDGVLGLLRTAAAQGASTTSADTSSAPLLKDQIATLESELKSTESRVEEMANARNEAAASERRVRRGLFRLASGRLTVEEVLIAVEKEDNGVSFMETLAMIDGMNNKNVQSSPDGTTTAVISSSDAAMSSPAFSAGVAGGSKDSPVANGEEVTQLKKSLQDIQVIAETRDKQITELLSEREKQLKRINSLIVPRDGGNDSPGEKAIRKSPLFIDAMTKIGTSERRIKELESAHEKIMQKWAAVKGDLELAKKTLADMEEKHGRRWTELISQFSESDSAAAALKVESSGTNNGDMFSNAKKTAELESKLQQAMEAVSRMETLRATLADAYKMNEQLQSKLEDLRIKNAKMVAEKVAAREKSKEAESADSLTSPHGTSKRSSSGGSSSGDPAVEKLQRDYRRARKEVSAAVLSKDQAKLKQERAEKERDALMKTNSRLLKQSSDKDDMNAKSLSTILHLKQRNEELEKENAIIKQKAQAAQQLSLAARLASNAKDRVGEEALKQKALLDETVKQMQKESLSLRKEKEQVEALMAHSKEKAASITKDLDAARTRCDDLVSESNKKEVEKKQMVESLAVVKKEATESAMKAASATGSGTGRSDSAASAFTMEQMTTQVKYLSGRINCPVCNVREKKCILLRCRHMFCQQCVDVNIKNRSRKCPACACRFDMKDVAEVWL